MPKEKVTTGAYLARAESLENMGDYVGAIRVVHKGLCDDPQNAALLKKREDLMAIICWRC